VILKELVIPGLGTKAPTDPSPPEWPEGPSLHAKTCPVHSRELMVGYCLLFLTETSEDYD